jgi:hypothetical protein
MLRIFTNDPDALHDEIIDALAAEVDPNGHKIETWTLDDNLDPRHTGGDDHWRDQGWLEFEVEPGVLVVRVRWEKGSQGERGRYGVLQGRFIEMLINHFLGKFTSIEFVDPRPPTKKQKPAIKGL